MGFHRASRDVSEFLSLPPRGRGRGGLRRWVPATERFVLVQHPQRRGAQGRASGFRRKSLQLDTYHSFNFRVHGMRKSWGMQVQVS